jgi:hypothetical protein
MATRLHGENSKEKTYFTVEVIPPRSKRNCTTSIKTSLSGNCTGTDAKLSTALKLPERSTVVRQINNFIKKLDLKQVERKLLAENRPDSDFGVYVCDASIDEWTTYVKSKNQALVSRAMKWKSGKIYIVEFPGTVHEDFVEEFKEAISSATGTRRAHLKCHGSSYVDILPHIEPDAGFGPMPGLGATRPAGFSWSEYHTLKLEVGVSRGWPQLDEKAEEWSQFPGVEYILLVRLSPKLRVRQFKLHSVVNQQIVRPEMGRTDIVNPTNVNFDSRRLLGLGANDPLPVGFIDPELVIDLFPLFQVVATLHP